MCVSVLLPLTPGTAGLVSYHPMRYKKCKPNFRLLHLTQEEGRRNGFKQAWSRVTQTVTNQEESCPSKVRSLC
ncbi:hypothetical protein PBY51_000002 [Eleginops maclovinus]|uniref:Uncharacterized protein n=1 Tax=Eleginops maclovinus TaxID=56733 RepID=A0AAN7XKQ1_ELEMC|nr:hypothetical protein PBY51_000002 [Eleginops maclovinus]